MTTNDQKYKRIEDHGIIGDLDTSALIAIDGTIDFMCFPYFDSPTIFVSLLDHEKGGCFSILPTFEDVIHKQMYLPDSNILLTRFLCNQGISEISDFMVINEKDHAHTLIRRTKAVRGSITFTVSCAPRFNYARCEHSAESREDYILFTPHDQSLPTLCLQSDVELKIVNNDVKFTFTLHEGETATFLLCEAKNHLPKTSFAHFCIESFKNTLNFWQKWIARSTYKGRWQEVVNRSALTLKLLTSRRHGSIIAAPTFSLPEELGGVRNWDYRYTWIRDASFSLYALMRLGFTEEAAAFMKWLEERSINASGDTPLQIMYGLDGRKELKEETLSHLEGYCGSSPVRIGNGAFNQLQLDIYGELMDSVYLYDKFGKGISFDLWDHLKIMIDWVGENWQREDESIWEIRGPRKEFLYSRLMCWVAVDRAIRLATKRSLSAPIERWQILRNSIHDSIVKKFWDPVHKTFVQYKNSITVDAANLLMPLIRYISPTDPKWSSTLAAISKNLVEDSLVFRYRIQDEPIDGIIGSEGTFNMCSFWYVECLSRAGDVRQARFLFEKMLSYANHLGLYAEELAMDGRHLGNFPQAFTHLALISAAYELDRSLAEHRIS